MKMKWSHVGVALAALTLTAAAAQAARIQLGAVDTRSSRAAEGLELEARFRSEPGIRRAEVRLEVFGFDPADFEIVEIIDEGVVERVATLERPLRFVVNRGGSRLLRIETTEIEFEVDPVENPLGLGAAGVRLRADNGTIDSDDAGNRRWVGIRRGDTIEAGFVGGAALFRARWGDPIEPPEEE
jgi:hypothetical protein